MSAFVRAKVEVGLATYRALHLLYGDSAEFLQTETDPAERALLEARLKLLQSLEAGTWKARGYVVLTPEAAAALAEDLLSWGEGGPVEEFRGMSRTSEAMVRGALVSLARKLEAGR